MKCFFCFVSITIFWLVSICAQEEPFTQNPFIKLKRPIKIAIMKFTGSEEYEKVLFNELCQHEYTRKNFEICPYESLNSIKKAYGIKGLDPNDKSILKKLYSNLGIEYIVFGEINNSLAKLVIKRTSDGSEIFNNEYKTKENSVLVQEMAKLFTEVKNSENKKMLKITFLIVPETADLIIDDVAYNQQREIMLDTGHHNVVVKMNGYKGIYRNIEVGVDKDIALSFRLEKEYIITFAITPEPVDLIIDNIRYGQKREIILGPGKHDVLVNKAGYYSIKQSIELGADTTRRFEYRLREGCEFTFDINPINADLFIDSIPYEKSRKIKLIPGVYWVNIKKNGFKEIIKEIEVTDKPKTFSYTLQEEYEITFEVVPFDAEIIIGDVLYGKKRKVNLTSGKHYLNIKKDGYIEAQKTIEINLANSKKIFKYTLELIPPNMILVIGGTYEMGSNSGNPDEKPMHQVTLKSYYIDKYEVTVAEYRKFCLETNRKMPKEPNGGWKEDSPIVNVSWVEASEYAKWAKKRLPTEAEWEYAARGGQKGVANENIYSGGNDINSVGWFISNSGNYAHQVGSAKKANELGIYDMSGNVWEWCADWFGTYQNSNKPIDNPQGPPTGDSRVLRGGAWSNGADACTVTYRRRGTNENRFANSGFRCVVDIN